MVGYILCALLVTAGLFVLTDVRPRDMTEGLRRPFEKEVGRKRRIRQITGSAPSLRQRLMEEAAGMLDASGMGEQEGTYRNMAALVAVAGVLAGLAMENILASVVLALVLGLPTGILISNSEKANRILRPVLDTMQTMPVFVYLIPALLLFGLGNASAVIATVIYAIVPVIRLTSLGIRQVDKEVVEAAKSFGSTRWQTLFKVQIPQAIPTIMTGVNQTLMMAMAMVVTCSMIGARGLGMEVLDAVNRVEIGRGLIAGGCVVILAVVLDRLTQGWFGSGKDDHETHSDE